ncbi:hypothetical protein [Flavobacterium facile]|uniref:hypothetical protein n=1 Tax=Flavobacterium facile TaxID=2893174 RepID=UPI002E75CE34|nr:hypothetical protein [Flavobacterium sp. T-12]
MSDLSINISKHPIKQSADIAKLGSNDLKNPNSTIFKNLNDYSLNKNNNHFDKIVDSLKFFPAFANLVTNINQPWQKFEVVFPKGILEKINSGELSFVKSTKASDELVAFVRDNKTNSIAAQLRIKDISEAADIEKWNNISTSLQNIAVMQQLQTITKILERFEEQLTLIVQEFNNDRIGKIQSGYSDYLIALQTNDIQTKKNILTNALSKLTEGRSQLIESLKTKVNLISNKPTGFWSSFFGSLTSWKYKEVNESIGNDIATNMFYIQRATQVIMAVKQELGEPSGMIQSLADYSDVINFMKKNKTIESLSEWHPKINWSVAISTIQAKINQIPEFQKIKNSGIILNLNK